MARFSEEWEGLRLCGRFALGTRERGGKRLGDFPAVGFSHWPRLAFARFSVLAPSKPTLNFASSPISRGLTTIHPPYVVVMSVFRGYLESPSSADFALIGSRSRGIAPRALTAQDWRRIGQTPQMRCFPLPLERSRGGTLFPFLALPSLVIGIPDETGDEIRGKQARDRYAFKPSFGIKGLNVSS